MTPDCAQTERKVQHCPLRRYRISNLISFPVLHASPNMSPNLPGYCVISHVRWKSFPGRNHATVRCRFGSGPKKHRYLRFGRYRHVATVTPPQVGNQCAIGDIRSAGQQQRITHRFALNGSCWHYLQAGSLLTVN